MPDSILAIIRDAVAHRYHLRPKPEITLETDLAEIADGVDIWTIWTAIQKQYDIDLPEREIARWQTVGDVSASVERERV